METPTNIAAFVKFNREKLKLTQEKLAEISGVGIHFIRNLEQNRAGLRFDKVNQVLAVFGFHLAPSANAHDPWQIWKDFLGQPVRILKYDGKEVIGFLMEPVRDEKSNIVAWQVLPNPLALEWKETKNNSLYVEVKQADIKEIHPQTL